MANQYRWYLPNQTVVALFLGITACFVWHWAKASPIPFDAGRWKQAEISGDFDIRYRMAHDLKSKIEKMDAPKFADLQKLLGPPQLFSNSGLESQRLKYVLGKSYLGPFPIKRWYLHLPFYENEQLMKVRISPSPR